MTRAVSDSGCRHSVEDRDEYLRTGRPNLEPHVRHCSRCRSDARRLRRLQDLTDALVQDDIRRAENDDTGWLDQVTVKLHGETRAGRPPQLASAPLEKPVARTEGSVMALIRATGDSVPGSTIGRCRLRGDLSTPGAEIRVQVHLSARWGHPLPGLVRALRERLFDTLVRHTELNVTGIDITVMDVHVAGPPLHLGPDQRHTASHRVELPRPADQGL